MVKAKDVMDKNILTISSDMAADEAGEFLVSNNLSSVPVIHDNGPKRKLLGFLSEADLLKFCSNQAYFHQPELSVSQIMRKHPYCVGEEVDVLEIAQIFMDTKYRTLPVIDDQGHLLGVIKRQRVLDTFLKMIKEEANVLSEKVRGRNIHEIVNHRFIVG